MGVSHTNGLHLPSLGIRNFRGIGQLSIKHLGRVTLIGGDNGAGKTTLLDAVRVHAARAHLRILLEVLNRNEEIERRLGENDTPVEYPDYTALFHGRTVGSGRPITIGPIDGTDNVHIEVSAPSEWDGVQTSFFDEELADLPLRALTAVYQQERQFLDWLPDDGDPIPEWWGRRKASLPWRRRYGRPDWSVTTCRALGPGLPPNQVLAHSWDTIALTDHERLSLEALQIAVDGVERIAVVGNEDSRRATRGRRVVVKLKDSPGPVPLKSLGDGVTRMFSTALALANSRNGILVLDEAENGIHYSLQRDFWNMVLRTAREYNIQVLATTHSRDCLRGFAKAAAQTDKSEGLFFRLDPVDGDRVRAVRYTVEDLCVAADLDIEVR